MLNASIFKAIYRSGQPVYIAVVGDSTTAGFGANPSANTWSNGLAYGCMNEPYFGANWNNDNPYYINTAGLISQAQFDNVGIPSAVRLLRTFIEGINPSSKVYNCGGSGYTAAGHVAGGTIATLAELPLKPQIIFINLGINSAKNNLSQDADMRILVAQCIAAGMLPVLVKSHNIGVAGSTSGAWSEASTPDQWYPMDNWPSVRAGIDAIAADNNLTVIDLGTPNCVLDVALLYDSFHPSNLGYQAIYLKYRAWIENVTLIGTGTGCVRVRNSRGRYIGAAGGAFKFMSPHGVTSLPMSLGASGSMRIKTSRGISTLKF